jgi:hypothetical protein
MASVVAVHGLGANPGSTWHGKPKADNPNSKTNWLSDSHMLPAIVPNSRIWNFNYESNWLRAGPIQRLPTLTGQLLALLSQHRHSVSPLQFADNVCLLTWVIGLRTTNADHVYRTQLWWAGNRTGELKISCVISLCVSMQS